MPLLRTLLVLLVLTAFAAPASAQYSDSLSLNTHKLPRPKLEMGLGVISFYGDVGNLGGISRRAELNWGYHLSLNNPISKTLGLNLFAMFGRINDNERLENGSADFETQIRMGGISLTYNFANFLPENRTLTPYISAGISTFEFNPKADRYDANGNMYYYWNDGSIRNIDQSADNAATAITLQRDRVYETDLRQTRTAEEVYALRSFSIPLGAGANIKVNDYFNLRMGTEFHLSLSDNIDNIESGSHNYASDRKGNDHFMYTSLGLSYNLHYNPLNKTDGYAPMNNELAALDFADEDNDGVADIVDLCPFTPGNAEVNEYGCPLDGDKDGVPDHLDFEPNTAAGAYVNSDGVTLSDEDIELMYLAYIDTVGDLQFNKSRTETADIEKNSVKMGSRKAAYRVTIEADSELDADEIWQLLSIPDLKMEETENGTRYYLGEYSDLATALENQQALGQTKVKTSVQIKQAGSDFADVSEKELASGLELLTPSVANANGVTFRVQIGAYKYKLSKNAFAKVPDLLIVQGGDGLTRYISGSFTNIKDAAEHKIDLLLEGFEGAFVTAYRNGKRITLKEAGATVNIAEDITTATSASTIDKSLVKFTVQLGSFDGRVPADVLSKYMGLGKVRPVRGENGSTKYVYGTYNTLAEAKAAKKELAAKGFTDAFAVGEYQGGVISSDEAEKIKNQ